MRKTVRPSGGSAGAEGEEISEGEEPKSTGVTVPREEKPKTQVRNRHPGHPAERRKDSSRKNGAMKNRTLLCPE